MSEVRNDRLPECARNRLAYLSPARRETGAAAFRAGFDLARQLFSRETPDAG
jgi:hypothetical protein